MCLLLLRMSLFLYLLIQTKLKHTCYAHRCIHIPSHLDSWISRVPIQNHNIHFYLLLFHIWNSLPQQCKMWLPVSSIYYTCLNLEYTEGDFRTYKPCHCQKAIQLNGVQYLFIVLTTLPSSFSPSLSSFWDKITYTKEHNIKCIIWWICANRYTLVSHIPIKI